MIDCQSYVQKCADAYKQNPPFLAFHCPDEKALMKAIRYFVRGCGHGLDVYPEDEAQKHLHLLWNAHIQAFFGTSHMAKVKDLTFKMFIRWVMEARSEQVAKR